MSTTSILDIQEIATSEASKETVANDAFERLATAGNDTLSVVLSGNAATVSADNFNTHIHFRVSGSTGTGTLTVPQTKRFFLVSNTSSSNLLTVKMPTGATLSLAVSSIAAIISDAVDLVLVIGSGLAGSLGYGGLPAELQNAPTYLPFGGQPNDGQVFHMPLTQAYTLPANFAGTLGYCGTVATADAEFEVGYVRSGSYTTVGTLTFAASANALTLSTQAAVNLLSTDILRVTTPSPQDATLADCGITIMLKKV